MGSKNRAVDSTAMRQNNAALLLRMIWEAGQMSRADMARQTGLSASTVSDITNELKGQGLIAQQGTGQSSGGRRPVLLGIQEDRVHILGIEIGATHITIIVSSFRGEILHARRVPSPTREDPQATLAQLFTLVDWAHEQRGVDPRALLGLGVAVPAPVDPQDPGHLSRLILPAWSEVDLLALLEERYARPVFIENDANAGAIAEHWFGAHDDVRDLTYVKVATGIGAGFIIDGRLYRGSGGTAGEIGHLAINVDDMTNADDRRLNSIIGTQAILARAGDVRPRAGEPVSSIHDVIAATLDGDRAALELVEFVGECLGTALAGLLNLINPRVVVLGGELTELQDILLDPLRISLRRQAFFSSVARTRLVTSRLGTNSIAAGAAALVLDAALRDLSLFPSIRTQGAA